MTKTKSSRPSFSLRLQPYDGSLLAEVVQFLNSLDRTEANRRVENVLVMALLAQARLYDQSSSHEERRRCCIEACDALDKHASMLRQLVGVEAAPNNWTAGTPMDAISRADRAIDQLSTDQRSIDSALAVDEGDENESALTVPNSRLNAIASPDDVDALFGG